MHLHVGPADATHAEAIVELSRICDPDRPEEPATWHEPQAGSLLLAVLTEPGGQFVGYASLRPDRAFPPETGSYRMTLAIHPTWRRQGAGSALYHRLEHELRFNGGQWIRTLVPDSAADTHRFLEHQGFEVYQRKLTLVQDLSSKPIMPVNQVPNVAIVPLDQELAQHPDCLPAVHSLSNACMRDVPTGDPVEPPPLDSFLQMLNDPALLHDCFLLAKEGDRYIGLSYAARSQNPTQLAHRFTGVHPDYRGRGLAKALKWEITRYALEHGYRKVVTTTQEANTAMIRVNLALGFGRDRTEVRYRKRVTPETDRSGPYGQIAPTPASPGRGQR